MNHPLDRPQTTLRKTLSNTSFPATTHIYHSFVDEQKKLIAVANRNYAQWSGRNISMRSESLLLYDMSTLAWMGCIDTLKFSVNDLSFHPDSTVIAVATGDYDGGAFFEGTLLLWNYLTGELQSVIIENREVTNCAFIEEGNKLKFTVSPTDDLDDAPFVATTYEVDYPIIAKLSLDRLTPSSSTQPTRFPGIDQYKNNIRQAEHRLSELANQAGGHFAGKNMIWDLVFLDHQRIAAARNQSTVEIWDIKTDEVVEIRLPKEGDCVQLFLNTSNQTLLVNCCTNGHPRPPENTIFSIDLASLAVKEIITCCHILSKNSENYFLARQTDHSNHTAEDFILDPDYRVICRRRLGLYDLFNHYLRIDDKESLYFLIGDPPEQHQNKILCSIDPNTTKTTRIWRIETQPEHFNELTGTRWRDYLILSGHRFQPLSSSDELFAIHPVSGKEIWHITLSGRVSTMAVIENIQLVVVALTNGQLVLIDCENGQTKEAVTPAQNYTFERPLSLAVDGTTLAVGLTNGEIRIYDVPKEIKKLDY